MATLAFSGKDYAVDDEGYLTDLNQWNEELANHMAEKENITLTDAHWEVINFIRGYYEEFEVTPMIRILVKALAKKLGPEKGNNKYLFELFPDGPAKQACKFAGLPKPTGCV